jgi:putative lipase involved disintegration of autophagic bodies
MYLSIITTVLLLLTVLPTTKTTVAYQQKVFVDKIHSKAVTEEESHFRPVQAFVLPVTTDGSLWRRTVHKDPVTIDLDSVNAAFERPNYVIKKKLERVQWPQSGRYHSNLKMSQTQSIEIDQIVPDVTDRDTVVALAEMAHNAYLNEASKEWHDLGEKWNLVSSVMC